MQGDALAGSKADTRQSRHLVSSAAPFPERERSAPMSNKYRSSRSTAVPGRSERPVAAAHREPLREQLRRRAAAPERHHRAARVARLRQDARLRDQRPEARGAGRAQLHAAARALFREPGRRRHKPTRGDGGGAGARLRLVRPLARRVRRHGLRARRRLGLGAAHLHAARRPPHQPVRLRAHARRSRAACRSSRSTCTSTPTTSTSAPTRGPTSIPSCATSTGRRVEGALRGRASRSRRRGRWCRRSSATCRASASRR